MGLKKNTGFNTAWVIPLCGGGAADPHAPAAAFDWPRRCHGPRTPRRLAANVFFAGNHFGSFFSPHVMPYTLSFTPMSCQCTCHLVCETRGITSVTLYLPSNLKAHFSQPNASLDKLPKEGHCVLAPGVLFSTREAEVLLSEAMSKLPRWGNIFNDVPSANAGPHLHALLPHPVTPPLKKWGAGPTGNRTRTRARPPTLQTRPERPHVEGHIGRTIPMEKCSFPNQVSF